MNKISDNTNDDAKMRLWRNFLTNNRVVEESVPLFATKDGQIESMAYGRNRRLVLKRSGEMDALMRSLGKALVGEYRSGEVRHNGILYLMFTTENGETIPRYLGKAEIFGKGDKNLSANISDLVSGDGKFGRWGYNYAYHIGDLSAAVLPGHPVAKKINKYTEWSNALLTIDGSFVKAKSEIRFWACLWGPDRQAINVSRCFELSRC